MRLISSDEKEKVYANISAVAYRELCEVLKPLSKEELWKVLDHYIFHCMTDEDVGELVSGLIEMKKTGVPLTAEAALSLLPVEKEPTRALKQAFPVNMVPTTEELEQSKDVLDLLFDETYFESYTPPELREQTAEVLVSFAREHNIPVMPHWAFYKN